MPDIFETTILADGPALYWRMGERTGTTAADASGNSRTGTYSGGYTLDRTGAITSSSDGSVSFNGTSASLRSSSYIFPTSSVTMAMWIWLDAYPSATGVVASCLNGVGSGVRDKIIRVTDAGLPSWVIFDGSNKFAIGGTPLSLAAWHLLTGTADGTTVRLYVDGEEVAATPGGPSFTGWSVPNVYVGYYSDDVSVACKIDEFAMWTSALPAARIRAHYNAGIARAFSPRFSGMNGGMAA